MSEIRVPISRELLEKLATGRNHQHIWGKTKVILVPEWEVEDMPAPQTPPKKAERPGRDLHVSFGESAELGERSDGG